MERAQVIESIREVAKKTLPPRSTLLLYGSRARGEEHQGSDWDLLILLDKAELSDNDYDKKGFIFSSIPLVFQK
jgi:predicted nucleotidyltransferase